MTLDQFIDTLTEIREAHGGAFEIRVGSQPSYPFENALAGVCLDETLGDHGSLVILAGQQIAYGKRAWWDAQSMPWPRSWHITADTDGDEE